MKAASPVTKKRILFVCIGNSCRSQMAEGFARKYGSDIFDVYSAGTAPASIVQPLTKKVMADKNISLDGQHPKHFSAFDLNGFSLIVNMSGYKLPANPTCELREWKVLDPIRGSEDVYVSVRDEIESLVMRLVLELRNGGGRTPASEKTAPPIRANSPFRMGRRR